jgi:hypothetical protein
MGAKAPPPGGAERPVTGSPDRRTCGRVGSIPAIRRVVNARLHGVESCYQVLRRRMSAPASPSPETRQSPSGQSKPSGERPLLSPAEGKQTGSSPPKPAVRQDRDGRAAIVAMQFRRSGLRCSSSAPVLSTCDENVYANQHPGSAVRTPATTRAARPQSSPPLRTRLHRLAGSPTLAAPTAGRHRPAPAG